MTGQVRIVVADDHPIVRRGLVGLLADDDDIEVVAEAADGHEAVTAAMVHGPDVVLMDLRMPHLDGVGATTRILAERPEIAVLVLTTFDTDEAIVQAIEAGATGYLLKDAPTADLAAAIRRAANGETVLAPPVSRRLVARMRGDAGEALTPREIEVLRAVAQGNANAAVARELHISEATVKTHLLHVYAKLGVSDRAAAVSRAYETGILSV